MALKFANNYYYNVPLLQSLLSIPTSFKTIYTDSDSLTSDREVDVSTHSLLFKTGGASDGLEIDSSSISIKNIPYSFSGTFFGNLSTIDIGSSHLSRVSSGSDFSEIEINLTGVSINSNLASITTTQNTASGTAEIELETTAAGNNSKLVINEDGFSLSYNNSGLTGRISSSISDGLRLQGYSFGNSSNPSILVDAAYTPTANNSVVNKQYSDRHAGNWIVVSAAGSILHQKFTNFFSTANRLGVGIFEINFTSVINPVEYSVVASGLVNSGLEKILTVANKSSSGFEIYVRDEFGNLTDCQLNVVVYY